MPPVSSASRNIKKLTSLWFEKTPYNYLNWRKISKAGRGKSGRIVLWTKSSIKHRLMFPKINYSCRYKQIALISTFRLIPFQNKLVSLLFFSSGSVTYLQAPESFKIFSFIYFPVKSRSSSIKKLYNNPSLFLLAYIKRLSRVSLVELYPGSGIQYVRSAGTSARIARRQHRLWRPVPNPEFRWEFRTRTDRRAGAGSRDWGLSRNQTSQLFHVHWPATWSASAVRPRALWADGGGIARFHSIFWSWKS